MKMVVALHSFLQLLKRLCCASTQWGQIPEHLHRMLGSYGGHNPPAQGYEYPNSVYSLEMQDP